MPIILAVEPDHKQAARLAAIVRHQVGAELVLGDTTEKALDALGPRVPDMVLVPALLSPQDDASLNAALRVIAAAAHVRTLTIPVLGSGRQEESSGGLLKRWRRGKADSPASTEGCDPAVFAEQISTYLKEAAAERAERAETGRVHTAIPDRLQAQAESQASESVKPVEDPWTWHTETSGTAETRAATASAAAERDEEITTETSSFDLDSALTAFESPESTETAPAASTDEPFGTYTLPSFEQVQAEAIALETSKTTDEATTFASAEVETPYVVDEPVALDTPIAFAESDFDLAVVDEPLHLDEPIAFDEPIVLAEPVVFEPPPIFEPLAAFESAAVSKPAKSPVAARAESIPAIKPTAAPESHEKVDEASVVAEPATDRAAAASSAAAIGMPPWRAWPPIEGVPIEVPGIAAATKADVPDWSELMASLRQDMERRRTQERHPAAAARKPRAKNAKPLVDEWGFFDPEQCGFSALLAKLDEITTTSQ